jgi:L-cysteine/cystine lyase
MVVGWDLVHRRGPTLAARLADGLAAVEGVRLVTPRNHMATLVTFRVAGWSAEAVLEELARRIFVIGRTIPPLDAVRLSVGFYTTEAEIDRVVETVGLIAAHTPETMPRRPTLPIIGP